MTAGSNVVPLHRCQRCGESAGETDLALAGEAIGTIRACDACIDAAQADLDSVRPVFDAMLTCGVSRELANETMTFLLDRQFQVAKRAK